MRNDRFTDQTVKEFIVSGFINKYNQYDKIIFTNAFICGILFNWKYSEFIFSKKGKLKRHKKKRGFVSCTFEITSYRSACGP